MQSFILPPQMLGFAQCQWEMLKSDVERGCKPETTNKESLSGLLPVSIQIKKSRNDLCKLTC